MRYEGRVAVMRFAAAMLNAAAAQLRLSAATVEATESVRSLTMALQAGYDEVIVQHPELMELDVMLDGFYGKEYDEGS